MPGRWVEAEHNRNPAGSVLDKETWHSVVEEAVTEAHKHGLQVTVIFIDIDQMKHINDSFGHNVGDQAIDTVRNAILKNLRLKEVGAEEKRNVDVIGYSSTIKAGELGGDEFGILCKTDEKGALALVRRLRESIQEDVAEDMKLRDLEVSIGVSVLQPSMSSSELLRLADHEMYEDKLGRMPELNKEQKKFIRQMETGLKQHNLRLRDMGKHLIRLSREPEG